MIEVLVVIVIFLIGILAIVQVFPKGLQLLVITRNNTAATALSRDLEERLKARPDMIPEMILPVRFNGTANVLDPTVGPNELGPMGDSLNQNGVLFWEGASVGNWQYYSGANGYRRIIGESHTVPAPRAVGGLVGGLLLAAFGPIDWPATPFLSVYGSDLVRQLNAPEFRSQRGAPEDALWDVRDRAFDYEYFVQPVNPGVADLYLPTGETPRQYRISFSGYVQNGAGYFRRDFLAVPVTIGATTLGPQGNHPLLRVNMAVLASPETLASVDVGSIRIARAFRQIPVTDPFDDGTSTPLVDPYEYKLLDNSLGTFLFNPAAYDVMIPKSGGREPLRVRLDYDVRDWRILREEFRVRGSGATARYRLPIGSLKVGNMTGVDGSQNGNMASLEGGADSDPIADNLVLVDLETGGRFVETEAGVPLVRVDKSLGLITLTDANNAVAGVQAVVALPTGSNIEVNVDERPIRALYRARQEWAVQMLKAASHYSPTLGVPGVAQFYVGGSDPGTGGVSTRIYFPPMDVNRKVNVAEIVYYRTGDSTPRRIIGQDFVIRYPRVADGMNLPAIDITEVDPNAAAFDYGSYGFAARGIKGASVAVRVIWNPDFFRLDSGENIRRLETWAQGYRKSTTETYLLRGDMVR